MRGTDEDASPLALVRVAPDRYEARVPLAPGAALRVEAGARRADGAAPVGATKRLVLEPSTGGARERQVPPESRAGLEALLARVTPSAAQPPGVTRLVVLAPWLALESLVAYLLDVLHRRTARRAPTFER